MQGSLKGSEFNLLYNYGHKDIIDVFLFSAYYFHFFKCSFEIQFVFILEYGDLFLFLLESKSVATGYINFLLDHNLNFSDIIEVNCGVLLISG